jgi:hypothetical protein
MKRNTIYKKHSGTIIKNLHDISFAADLIIGENTTVFPSPELKSLTSIYDLLSKKYSNFRLGRFELKFYTTGPDFDIIGQSPSKSPDVDLPSYSAVYLLIEKSLVGYFVLQTTDGKLVVVDSTYDEHSYSDEDETYWALSFDTVQDTINYINEYYDKWINKLIKRAVTRP